MFKPFNINPLIKPLLDYPKRIIFLVLFVSVAAFSPLSGLKPDNSIDVWFYPKEKVYREYEDFKNNFGNDANIVIIYRQDNLFSKEQLALNRRLTERLSIIENIKGVTSLTTMQSIEQSPLSIVPMLMIDKIPTDPEEMRKEAVKNPVLIDNVLSRDGKATAITLELAWVDDKNNEMTVKKIKGALDEADFKGNKYYLMGVIPILVEMNYRSNKESAIFVTINIFIIFFLLCVIFRSFRFAFLPIIVAIISTIWTMALYAGHNTLNMVSSIMPLIIMVISIADAVHVISQYRLARVSGMRPEESLKSAIDDLCLPCLFTSLTTAMAFLAFLFSSIPPLQALGFYTALGVLIAYLLSFTLLPALILVTDSCYADVTHIKVYNRPTQWLENLPLWVSRNRNTIILVSLAIMIISVFGLRLIRVETDEIRFLKPSNPIRHANDLSQQWFDGIYPSEIVLSASEKGHFHKAENLKIVKKLEKLILEDEMVETVFSPLTFLLRYYKVLSRKGRKNISSDEMTLALKLMLSGKTEQIQRFLTLEGDRMRIAVRSRWLDNEQLKELVKRLDRLLEPYYERAGIKGYFTGISIMYTDLNHRLIKSQISSFAISFALIFIMILLLARRWSLAVLGMIPNIFPVLTTMGLMGWLGVKLDVATVLIAAVSLGIAIDDTIHLIYVYKTHEKRSKSVPDCLSIAIRQVGRPVFITSVVIIGGFSVMILSDFQPIIYFGAFISLNVLLAFLYDIILLPALLNFLHLRDRDI